MTIMSCCLAKFFFSLNVIRKLKDTYRFAFPAYAMLLSAVEALCAVFFTARREVSPWKFWLLRLLATSTLASSIACFVLGRSIRDGALEKMLAAFLGMSTLEFAVSTLWAYRFWRTPSIRVYAPVCVIRTRYDKWDGYVPVGTGTLSQLYEQLLAESQLATGTITAEKSLVPIAEVSTTSAEFHGTSQTDTMHEVVQHPQTHLPPCYHFSRQCILPTI